MGEMTHRRRETKGEKDRGELWQEMATKIKEPSCQDLEEKKGED